MELHTAEVELGEILDESARVLSFQAEEKRLAIRLEAGADLRFRGDRRAVKQILLNLMSNAVKFTPEGGSVTIRARPTSERIIIDIIDTGIGIPTALIHKIGRPFVQVANQFTKTHQGSGLGLAIARSLIEMHGGTMQLQSDEGKGTTVRFDLPRRPRIQPQSAVA